MKFIKLRNYIPAILILVMLVSMWGCGSSGQVSPTVVGSKNASVTITPSSGGEYVINGDNMDGVEGMELTVNYDSTTLFSPIVTQGGLISGAPMISNITTPGKIQIAWVLAYPKVLSGSGQIVTVSFASVTGTGSVSLASVTLKDINGNTIQ